MTRPSRNWPAMATLAIVAATALAGCSGSGTEFSEPDGIVIWSEDGTPPTLPAGTPAETDPSVDRLVNATVLAADAEHVVVVGDMTQNDSDVTPPAAEPGSMRVAVLLHPDGRLRQLLGVIDGDSDQYSGRPGRRLGAGLDAGATSVRVFTSRGTTSGAVYVDPVTGQVFTFVVAAEGETLYGIHALDPTGRVTDVVGIAP